MIKERNNPLSLTKTGEEILQSTLQTIKQSGQDFGFDSEGLKKEISICILDGDANADQVINRLKFNRDC